MSNFITNFLKSYNQKDSVIRIYLSSFDEKILNPSPVVSFNSGVTEDLYLVFLHNGEFNYKLIEKGLVKEYLTGTDIAVIYVLDYVESDKNIVEVYLNKKYCPDFVLKQLLEDNELDLISMNFFYKRRSND